MKSKPDASAISLITLIILVIGTVCGFFALIAERAQHPPWIEYYFPCLFLAISVLCVRALPQKSPTRPGRHALFFASVFAAFFAYRLWIAPSSSLWLDENLQILTSLELPPVSAGLRQHQPPLEFALMRTIFAVAGFSETSVRLSAMVFSALGAALVGFLYVLVTEDFILAAAASLFFSFNSVVGHYGSEARPISMGLATSLLVLCACARFFKDRMMNRAAWIQGFAASVLSLFSLGLQPPFLLFSLSAVTLAFPKFRLREKLWLVSQWTGALLVFLPVQIWIFRFAPPRFSRIGAAGVQSLANQLRWNNFSDPWKMYGAPLVLTVILGAGAFAFGLRSKRRSKPDPTSGAPGAEWFFAGVALVFVLALVPFFKALVDWDLYVYYMVLGWPVGLLALAYACRRWNGGPVLLAGLILWSVAFHRALWSGLQNYASYHVTRSDYRSAYKEITARRLPGENAVFSGCLAPQGRYCPEWLIGHWVYLNADFDFPKERTIQWLPQFLNERAARSSSISLLVDHFNEPLPHHAIELSPPLDDVEHFTFKDIDLFTVRSSVAHHPLERLLELAQSLDQQALSQGIEEINLIPLLILGNQALGRTQQTRRWLEIGRKRNAFDSLPVQEALISAGLLQQSR